MKSMYRDSASMIYKYFDISEFDCQHTGENKMNAIFVALLDKLRGECGFSFVITSGYRSPEHPIEAAKDKPGVHSEGIAADIKVRGGFQRFTVVNEALKMGFTGIGVGQDFVHVDLREYPVMWTYGG